MQAHDHELPEVRWGPEEVEEFARQLQEELAHMRQVLPDVDPGDMVHILGRLIRPFGTGMRFFLRRLPDGGHVF